MKKEFWSTIRTLLQKTSLEVVLASGSGLPLEAVCISNWEGDNGEDTEQAGGMSNLDHLWRPQEKLVSELFLLSLWPE